MMVSKDCNVDLVYPVTIGTELYRSIGPRRRMVYGDLREMERRGLLTADGELDPLRKVEAAQMQIAAICQVPEEVIAAMDLEEDWPRLLTACRPFLPRDAA